MYLFGRKAQDVRAGNDLFAREARCVGQAFDGNNNHYQWNKTRTEHIRFFEPIWVSFMRCDKDCEQCEEDINRRCHKNAKKAFK